MALNIKNREVEELATELARKEGLTKTEVIRLALLHRRESAEERKRRAGAMDWLRTQIWPTIPESARRTLTKEEKEELLGYGEHGV